MMVVHRPLAAELWPPRAVALADAVRAVTLMLLGVALLTASAKVSIPLPPVPMTLQTLVVLMVGALYGWKLGVATVLAYLAAGALGLPVFAGSTGGLAPLLGATAGFLFGFVVGAPLVGWFSERGWDRSVLRTFVAMAAGHGVILAMGFIWLAWGRGLGVDKAWAVGVAPFLVGAVVKNLVGALLVPALRRWAHRARP
jgi:biotin transport system substrate-specific component